MSLYYHQSDKTKRVERSTKRTRSNSNGEINYGVEEELDDRYYNFTVCYIKSLMSSGTITNAIYSDIFTNGEIDVIICRKRIDGIQKLYNTKHEDRICKHYVKKQRENELSTWASIFSQECREYTMSRRTHCYAICNDLVRYISNFI
jgi:hypothetical protein